MNQINIGGQLFNITYWELGMTNKITVSNVIKVSQMVMGQFGTLINGPRRGEQVMLFQDGWVGFLATGSILPLNSCIITEHRVRIEEELTIKAQQ